VRQHDNNNKKTNITTNLFIFPPPLPDYYITDCPPRQYQKIKEDGYKGYHPQGQQLNRGVTGTGQKKIRHFS
jgi:hypothetical protein